MQSWAILQFPGSNSDRDAFQAAARVPNVRVEMLWHDQPIEKNKYDVIMIPGGFSFGDYLRAGAIAKLSTAMASLSDAVEAGAHVIGICNGFQILLESRLLPGILQVNKGFKFISRMEECEVKSEAFPWFAKEDIGRKFRFPIAHRFGNYQVKDLDRFEMQAALIYQNNPNGSFQGLAGIYRKLGKGSLFGLMPHPERVSHPDQPVHDGADLWLQACKRLAA